MEGDKDMTLVILKSYTETPDDWRNVRRSRRLFDWRSSRIKPSPLTVITCSTEVNFQTWTVLLTEKYVNRCPIPKRPIQVLKIDQKDPSSLLYKTRKPAILEAIQRRF